MTARQYLGGYMRPRFGFVATWENAAGRTLTVHRVGPVKAQLLDVIRVVLSLDPSFRLVGYSTPDTILTDLQGRTLKRADDGRPVPLPESIALGMVGRLELLHPRFDTRRREELTR